MKKALWSLVFLALAPPSFAASATVNKADTAWLLVSSSLVLLMVPGLALFYGGMVRSKNAINTLMMSLVCMGIVTIEWIALGYSLSFGEGLGGFLGGLDHLFLKGVGMAPLKDYAATVPGLAFVTFQMMFAIITPALVSGAVVERMKFSAYILFILLWSIFVYDPICHWVWAKDGWLFKLGALDFAGGTVVHINAGVAAIVAALVLGKREGFLEEKLLPHSVIITALGTGLLWFGWFGFNAGSALESGKLAAMAFITTHIAAAAGAFSWLIAEYIRFGKASTIGFCSGAVAGLVAITPASGFVGVKGALIIGIIAGVLCSYTVELKMRFGYDDSLDVFGVHGIGGLWGAIATGLFASIGAKGLIYGGISQLLKQVAAIVATIAYSAVVTFVILKVLDAIIGLRVSSEDEEMGLDLTQHGEEAYRV